MKNTIPTHSSGNMSHKRNIILIIVGLLLALPLIVPIGLFIFFITAAVSHEIYTEHTGEKTSTYFNDTINSKVEVINGVEYSWVKCQVDTHGGFSKYKVKATIATANLPKEDFILVTKDVASVIIDAIKDAQEATSSTACEFASLTISTQDKRNSITNATLYKDISDVRLNDELERKYRENNENKSLD